MDDRRVDEQALVFGDSGLRLDDAIVFWDHETSSLWEQWRALAFEGSWTGVRLVRLSAPTLRWSEWQEEFPETMVLSGP